MFDRRRFLQLFTAGAVGLAVAEQLALATDIKDWMLSPAKTIFIPPVQEGILEVQPIYQVYTAYLKYEDTDWVITKASGEEIRLPMNAQHWTGIEAVPGPTTSFRMEVEELGGPSVSKPLSEHKLWTLDPNPIL